jgi:hypothetical protein
VVYYWQPWAAGGKKPKKYTRIIKNTYKIIKNIKYNNKKREI